MKGRNAKTVRIYRIISILEGAPHGLTATQILSRINDQGYEINKKTVYRDLEGLKAMGVPLIEKGRDDDNGIRWAIEKNTKVGHYLILSARELMALYLARGVLAPLKETPFYEDLSSTFTKIEEQVSRQGKDFLEEVASDFHFEAGPKWGLGLEPDVIDTVRAACTEKQQLKINYSSANSQTTKDRIVGPKFLYFAQGSLYLVAEEIETQIMKTFSVPRINNAEMLDIPYEGEEVDPDIYFGNSFGIYGADSCEKVTLEFHTPVSSFIKERKWHKSQQVINKENGRIEVRFELGITPEFIQWVLGFGSSVKVLEPNSLKEAICSRAEEIIKTYHTD